MACYSGEPQNSRNPYQVADASRSVSGVLSTPSFIHAQNVQTPEADKSVPDSALAARLQSSKTWHPVQRLRGEHIEE